MGETELNPELIIFDLDGTLIDSSRDIAKSINLTLQDMGLPKLTLEQVIEGVGHGPRQLVLHALRGQDQRLSEAFERFGGHYSRCLLDDTTYYPGVIELFEDLRDRKLGIASNKSEGYCRKIMEGLGHADRFELILGWDSVEKRKPDAMMLERIMKHVGTSPEETIMVGDTPVDIEAGKNAGVRTVAVLQGFYPSEKLKECNADHIIKEIKELSTVL